jgi:F0F1-type ATP synthase beta subunit
VLRAVADAADVALRLSQVIDATVPVSRAQAATGSAPAVDPHQSATLATAA